MLRAGAVSNHAIIHLDNCAEASPDAQGGGSPTESFVPEVQITQHPLVAFPSLSTKPAAKRRNHLKSLGCCSSETLLVASVFLTRPQSCCGGQCFQSRVATSHFVNIIETLRGFRIFCDRFSSFSIPGESFGASRIGTLPSSLPICDRSTDGFACSNVLQAAEEKDNELPEQDKLTRTARVQPTPQTKDPDGPNTPSTDRRK